MSETLNLLLTRRSVVAINLGEPGPSPEQIEIMQRAGLRVPDHGKLAPWRFLLFEGDARRQFGSVLKEAFMEDSRRRITTELDLKKAQFPNCMRGPLIAAARQARGDAFSAMPMR